MIRKKMTTITTSSHERWIIRARRTVGGASRCPACGANAVQIGLAACETAESELEKIFELIKSGGVHVSATPEGHVVLCAASLESTIKGEQENEI